MTRTRTRTRTVRVFGFADGDRVRDRRSGCTGQVRFLALTAAERVEVGVAAEVVWDGFGTAVDLALVVDRGLELIS
ncbi:hypothetical protein ACU61A_41015 [Pseudonocardia sichuanensis]